jgi:tetratricopeptide (TPR) repeat protein
VIRQLLVDESQPAYDGFDAALRRGDFIRAQAEIGEWGQGQETAAHNHLALRQAVLAYFHHRWDEAEAHLEPVTTSITALTAPGWLLRALLAVEQKHQEKAEAALAMATRYYEGNRRGLLYCRLVCATLHLYLGQYEAMAAELQRIEDHLRFDGDSWARYQHRRLHGLLAHQQDDYATALRHLTAARRGFRHLGDAYELARCDKALANTFRRLGEPQAALYHAQQALDYFRGQGLTIAAARCYNTLGSIQLEFDRQSEALDSFRAAAIGLSQAGLELELAGALHNIGLLYRLQGRFRPALQALTQARHLAARLRIPEMEAAIAEQEAQVLRHLGRSDEALRALQGAADRFLGLGAEARAAVCWLDQAQIMLEEGRGDDAVPLLQRAREVFLSNGDGVRVALTDIGLAQVHWQHREPHQAIALLREALTTLQNRRHGRQAATAAIWLGHVLLSVGEDKEAEAAFQLARRLAPAAWHELGWRASAGLATIARRRNERKHLAAFLEETITQLNRLRGLALSPQAAARLAAASLPVYEEAIALALDRGYPETALSYLESQKAGQLLGQWQERFAEPGEVEPGETWPLPTAGSTAATHRHGARLEAVRQALGFALNTGNTTWLARLEATYQHLVETLTALNAPFATLYRPPRLDLAGLRRRLDERHGPGRWACLVYGWPGSATAPLHRFWWDGHRLLAAPLPLTRLQRQLVRLASRSEPSYRHRLLDWKTPSAMPPEWSLLAEFLLPSSWRPLPAELTALYVIPSGPLSALPFAALPYEGEPLGLHYALAQTPSLLLLDALLRRHPYHAEPALRLETTRGLVCYLDAFPKRPALPALSATGREAFSLLKRLAPESALLQGSEATWTRLQSWHESGKLATFALIHFATHALFHPHHPYLSHLVLADRELTVADILGWWLQARLVVLAACETAIGHVYSGDEQIGLPHAFLLAGAETVLATSWPVSDEATAAFLEGFYTALAAEAPTPAQALRAARRHTAGHSTAYVWGALDLIGLA